jgi:hypothetical protein
MQVLMQDLNLSMLEFSQDPNISTYAAICAGISVSLFAIAIFLHFNKLANLANQDADHVEPEFTLEYETVEEAALESTPASTSVMV